MIRIFQNNKIEGIYWKLKIQVLLLSIRLTSLLHNLLNIVSDKQKKEYNLYIFNLLLYIFFKIGNYLFFEVAINVSNKFFFVLSVFEVLSDPALENALKDSLPEPWRRKAKTSLVHLWYKCLWSSSKRAIWSFCN